MDGVSGTVLQTPIQIANQHDRGGRALPHAIRLQINKELPVTFRLPNKAPVTEQTIYAVLYNVLNALLNTGVGVCGGSVVKPLAGPHGAAGVAQLSPETSRRWTRTNANQGHRKKPILSARTRCRMRRRRRVNRASSVLPFLVSVLVTAVILAIAFYLWGR